MTLYICEYGHYILLEGPVSLRESNEKNSAEARQFEYYREVYNKNLAEDLFAILTGEICQYPLTASQIRQRNSGAI